MNRTFKAWALAIVGAEYVLGWLPRGTHQWDRFITPDELAGYAKAAGLNDVRFEGITYQSAARRLVAKSRHRRELPDVGDEAESRLGPIALARRRRVKKGEGAMFPIGDDDSQVRISPIVTTGLIVANVLFFLVELNGGDEFIQQWAFIPSRFTADPASNWPTIFTAMFMHGGWMHLFGNMLYLYIFGDNVEERLRSRQIPDFLSRCRHRRDLRSISISTTARIIPNLGASGAIAGVLGAYMLLFPHARVDVLIIRQIVSMPALDRHRLLVRPAAVQRRRIDCTDRSKRRMLAASPTWLMSAASSRASPLPILSGGAAGRLE